MAGALSGFPEWLPQVELVQQELIGIVRREFELHGFTPLVTRSLEPLDALVGQGGETDKEVYGVHRLAAPERGGTSDTKMGLHYDLTVPFARYVGERRGELTFPFRRYQVQPAWRGERPQLGRFREFIQADADVIVQGTLDLRFDIELVRLLRRTLDRIQASALPIPRVKLLLNNRKLLEGFYRGLGVEAIAPTLRVIDKLGKIGPEKVHALLVQGGLTSEQATACIGISKLELHGSTDMDKVRALGVTHPLLDEGMGELGRVIDAASKGSAAGSVVGALHIARGLDYYTGTVVEGVFEDHPELGAVCSGGRYDNLASDGKQPLPGVGVSLGISRIMGYAEHLGLIKATKKTPAAVVVALHSEEERALSEDVADALRARGIATLVSDSSAAYGKQIKSASQLGISFVWFPGRAGQPDEVKNIVSGTQAEADRATWTPAS